MKGPGLQSSRQPFQTLDPEIPTPSPGHSHCSCGSAGLSHPWGLQQCPQQPLPEAGGADLLLLILSVVGVLQQLDFMESQLGEPLMREGSPEGH